jgi:hypothetical protein
MNVLKKSGDVHSIFEDYMTFLIQCRDLVFEDY